MGKVNPMIQHARIIVDKGRKLALVRELALALGCGPDVVADIQKHYGYRKAELEAIKEQGGLK